MAATSGGIKAGKAFVIIDAVDKTGVVLKRVGRQLKGFARQMQGIAKKFVTRGLAALLPAGASLKVFANFDDAMRRVESRSTGTTSAMKALRDEAKLLGRTTSFTATQVGDLMGVLAQKNFGRGEIKAMTGDILNLARAAGSGDEGDTALAADLVSGTLRAFQMDASQAGKVTDIFSTAVNNSNFDLAGLMDGMKKAAPLAKEYGLSLEETTASLAAMTNLNIEASEAGTAFQSFLARMSQPQYVDKFNKGLEEMGVAAIDFQDEAGNLRKPMDIMQDIGDRTAGMGTAVKGELLSALFGVRQFGKAAGSISGGAGAAELLEKLENSGGAAAKTAADMDRGIGGSFRKIMSAVEGLAIEIGETLAPTIADLVDKATAWIGTATEWIQANKGMVIFVTGLAVGAVALGVGLMGLSVIIGVLGSVFSILGTVISVVTTTIGILYGVITSPFFIVGLAIAGIIALLWNFNTAFRDIFGGIGEWVSKKFSAMGETITKTFGSVIQALGNGEFMLAWELVVEGAKLIWAQFMDTLKEGWRSFTGFFVEAWIGAVATIKQLWFKIQNFITNAILKILKDNEGLSSALSYVIGADVAKEAARGIELERQRIESTKRLGIDSGGPNNSFDETLKVTKAQYDAKIEQAATDAAAKLDAFNAATDKASNERAAEIEKRKAALQALQDEVDLREEANIVLEDFGDIMGADGGATDAVEDVADAAEVDSGVGPGINTGLMKGTVAAAQQAYKNSMNAPEKKVEELVEESNTLLDRIHEEVANIQIGTV